MYARGSTHYVCKGEHSLYMQEGEQGVAEGQQGAAGDRGGLRPLNICMTSVKACLGESRQECHNLSVLINFDHGKVQVSNADSTVFSVHTTCLIQKRY